MTLTIYREMEQGSDEWLEARRGLVTASNVGKLLTPTLQVANNETSRGITLTLAAERLSGYVEEVYVTSEMERGNLDEPHARNLYAANYAAVEQIGFATREIHGHFLGASPDGLVGDHGGLEIKSRNAKVQLRTILNDEVPAENIAQIHASMLVMDRKWWDYCSYAGGWPLYIKRVHRDSAWDAAITDALDAFEERVARITDDFSDAVAGAPIAPRIDHWADIEVAV